MSKQASNITSNIVAVKSKFNADIIRFSINRDDPMSCEDCRKLLAERHALGPDFKFDTWYTDPTDGDLLPINNDVNLKRALESTKHLLRVIIQRQGEGLEDKNGCSTIKSKKKPKPFAISQPHDFRQVSAIIDVDILPETYRRVKLLKRGRDKPLGFFIKEGESYRVDTNGGVEKVPGVFISRIVPGGLAEATGLLAANDEVLEVNGIEVAGRTLDQVTDMMIANSSNLIITVKPANQRAALAVPQSMQSAAMGSDDEADEITDLTDAVHLHDDVIRSHHHHHRDDDDNDDLPKYGHRDQGVLHL